MENISTGICKRVTKEDIVRGAHAYLPLKDLQQNIKV